MHVNKNTFERNSSLEYYHKTCVGKTKHTTKRSIEIQALELLGAWHKNC